ncbi:hypothetical protein REPUB_Repub15cG0014700 [Reevesia pubescens]
MNYYSAEKKNNEPIPNITLNNKHNFTTTLYCKTKPEKAFVLQPTKAFSSSSSLKWMDCEDYEEGPPSFELQLYDITKEDNAEKFIELIKSKIYDGADVLDSVGVPEILYYICLCHAVNCATALFQELTCLEVDVNANLADMDVPALFLGHTNPKLVELFLRHGARTDIRCSEGMLPLNSALCDFSEYRYFSGWSAKQSIYMMIIVLCFPKLRNALEGTRLIFRATKKVEKEIYHYAEEGKLIEIAVLLMVARKEVMSPSLFESFCDSALDGSKSLRDFVSSKIITLRASKARLVYNEDLKNKLETMMSMLQLLEVFERLGDKIDSYCSQHQQTKVSNEEAAIQLACLFNDAGLAEYKDFELTDLDRSCLMSTFHKLFLESIASKLHGENEKGQLGSQTRKHYKEHLVDSMSKPHLSNQQRGFVSETYVHESSNRAMYLFSQPRTLETIPSLNHEDDARDYLPLNVALEKLSNHPYLNDWIPKKSTFKLVYILCVPELKESLESIRLAACKIEEIGEISCNLAREGKLIELASLLMVAQERLIVTTSQGSNGLSSESDGSARIRKCIMSDLRSVFDAEVRLIGRSNMSKLVQRFKNEKEVKLSALLLLEAFERAGNSINQYLQSDTYNEGTRLQVAKEIQFLLKKAGFVLKQSDTDLNDLNCFSSILDPEHSGKCRTSLARDGGQLFALQPHQISIVEPIKALSSSSSLKWMDCEEGYEGYEDEFLSFELRLYDITKEDNAEKFIELIKSKIYDDADVLDSVGVPEILYNICLCQAVNCATALFQELTCLEVDVNTNLADMDVPALNVAHSNPKLVELFLRHGARTDIRSPKGRLPLNSSLYDFSNYDYFSGWSAKQSIYMMIIVLCFPKLRKALEGNRLIFKATKEVEKEIYHYAEEGKLIEIAVLLMVARKEVMSPSLFESLCGSTLDGSKSLRDFILSKIISLQVSETRSVYNEDLKNQLETMMSMLQLLEVFERLGDKIDSYCSQHQQTKASNEEAAIQLACLFNDEGLAEYYDFELTDLDRSCLMSTFHKFFLESIASKLHGENEKGHLGSQTRKHYKEHLVDSMSKPHLFNQQRGFAFETYGHESPNHAMYLFSQPRTLETIRSFNHEDDTRDYLPLNVALETLSHHPYLNDWIPKKSTLKLVYILCLPELKESLESIRLAACKIEEIGAISCNLAREGRLIELASLLMVAQERLIVTTLQGSNGLSSESDGSTRIRKCIMSDLRSVFDAEGRLIGRSNMRKLVQRFKDEKEVKLSALLLLEVFERAGNSINQYLRSDTYNEGTRLQVAKEIQFLLRKAGFVLKQSDTDLNDLNCFSSILDPEHSGKCRTSLARDAGMLFALQPHQVSVVEWMDCEEGYEGYEDQEFLSFELQLFDIIKEDNAEKFIQLINSKIYDDADVLDSVGVPEILNYICLCHAENCATALFQELTCLEVDVNANLANIDVPALYVAHPNPKLVELFLRHGARTDIRSPKGRLPLNTSLNDFSNYRYFSGWSAKQSIYMMIIVLCFPNLRKALEGNKLIFRATKEVEKEIYHYAEEGKLIEIAVLLMVARKEVMSPSLFESFCGSTLDGSKSLRDFVLSKIISLQVSETRSVYNEDLKNKLETMMSMLQLLEVFERLGDKIDSYCSQHQQTKASNEEVAVQLACLFIDEGLAEYKDFELTNLDRWCSMSTFHKLFLESIASKLYGENENGQLGSQTRKHYKEHLVDSMSKPHLSNQQRGFASETYLHESPNRAMYLFSQPRTLETIPSLKHEDDARDYLPLNVALEKLSNHPYLKDWIPKKSTFKLVYILCLPELKESLESIRLAAFEIEEISCNLAREGKLIELASLLMVAQERLIVTTSQGSNGLSSESDGSTRIRKCIMSDLRSVFDAEVRLIGRSNMSKLVERFKDEKEVKLSALLLLEVFERAGNSINQYLQSDTYNEGTRLQVAKEIQFLLKKAGFVLKQSETDLNGLNCFASILDPEHSGKYRTSLARDAGQLFALQPLQISVVESKKLSTGAPQAVVPLPIIGDMQLFGRWQLTHKTLGDKYRPVKVLYTPLLNSKLYVV